MARPPGFCQSPYEEFCPSKHREVVPLLKVVVDDTEMLYCHPCYDKDRRERKISKPKKRKLDDDSPEQQLADWNELEKIFIRRHVDPPMRKTLTGLLERYFDALFTPIH